MTPSSAAETPSSSTSTSTSTPSTKPLILHLIFFLAIIFSLLAEVTSYYHGNLVLDFLCDSGSSDAVPVFVRDVPWDCSAYVVCVRGKAMHTLCPADKLYDRDGRGRRCQSQHIVDSRRCRGQIHNYLSQLCQANPTVRVPDPDSCSQFYDCAAKEKTHQVEQGNVTSDTPNQQGQITSNQGQITSADTWRTTLEKGWITENTGRLQFAPDGGQMFQNSYEKVQNSSGQTLQNSSSQPIQNVSGEMNQNSSGQTVQEAKSEQTTTQSKGTQLFVDYLLECPYPLLFSPDTGDCADPLQVACRGKFEPKAPCEYLQYLQLYGNCASPACSDCVQHHPSCLTFPDGLHPVPGRRDVMMHCVGERTLDFVTCPPGFTFGKAGMSDCVRVY